MKNINFKNTRNSNIELIRILAMIFIILSHSSIHGGFDNCENIPFVNSIILDWMTLGNIGIGLFVLITGYYMCEKNTKIESFTHLYGEIIFYSVSIFIILSFINKSFNIKDLIKSFFPIIFNSYGFCSAYFILLIFIPIINKVIKDISPQKFLNYIIFLIILIIVIPTITMQNYYFNDCFQFLLYYLIGSYLKKFNENKLKNKKNQYLLTFISFILLFSTSLIVEILSNKFKWLEYFNVYFYRTTSILVLGCSVGLFSIFSNLNVKHNKIINLIGSCIFGIYLIHDNFILRDILWLNIIKNFEYVESNLLFLRLIVSAGFVFLTCLIIDLIRKVCFEKIINIFYDKLCYKIYSKFINNDKTINNLKSN